MATEGLTTAVIPKLNGKNYSIWKFNMKMLLLEKDLWTTIIPGEPKPEDSQAEQLRKYVSRHGKALAKICLHLEAEQQLHIQHLNCPRDVWLELEKLYAPRDSKYRIVQLRRSLYCEKFQRHENMDSYLGQINFIAHELSNIGDKIEDSDLAMVILCGLDENYENVVSTICNLSEGEFTSATVKRRLLAEYERRQSAMDNLSSPVALSAHGSGTTGSNGKLSTPKNPPRTTTKRKEADSIVEKKYSTVTCYRCGKKGHIARMCRTKGSSGSGQNKTAQQKPQDQTPYPKNMSIVCEVSRAGNNDIVSGDKWVVDSGATHHMTPNISFFTELQQCPDYLRSVALADGSALNCTGMGMVKVEIQHPTGILLDFHAQNTMLLPKLRHSVLSVQQLMDNDKRVVFSDHGCQIMDTFGNVLIEAKRDGRLFVVESRALTIRGDNSANTVSIAESASLPLKLWHRRFMHVNQDRILKMSNMKLVEGLSCKGGKEYCEGCLIGKATRKPFPEVRHVHFQETEPLALVHVDLLGPLCASLGHSRYMLCIVDEATRYIFVYFVRRKGDVLERVKVWMTEVERQIQRKVRRIRSDNGLEFCSHNFNAFCTAHGIQQERTMVYTPQQNGVAERMNRTLLNLVRSTLCPSNLPDATWAELAATAAYVRNRTTNKHNELQTPYELMFGKKPSVRHLRACGCEVAVHIPRPKQRGKLAARAKKGILVGYVVRDVDIAFTSQRKNEL